VSNVIYLHEKFPKKDWPLHYIGKEISLSLLKEDEKKAEQLFNTLADQFVESQMESLVETIIKQEMSKKEGG
jgi:hypothetical protein